MSVSPPQLSDKLHEKMYFSWAGKLWYLMNLSADGDMAFVEDCRTEKVRWIKTALFEDECKEVKLIEC